MLTVNSHKPKKTVRIPDQWRELNPEQFVYVCSVLDLFNRGTIDLDMARLLILYHLSGYRPGFNLNKIDMDTVNSNLYLISEKLMFPVKYLYEETDEYFNLTPQSRKTIEKIIPLELDEEHPLYHELSHKAIIPIGMAFDVCLSEILLPHIKVNRRKYVGPEFAIHDGILSTNITAEEFCAAYDYYIQAQQDPTYDKYLAACLYRPEKRGIKAPFNEEQVKHHARALSGKPLATYAAKIQFMGLLNFIKDRTPFSAIWSQKKSEDNDTRVATSLRNEIHGISKTGYGSIKEISKINLIEFLELLMEELKSSIRALSASGLKNHEIASKLNIPLYNVNQLI